MQHWNWHNWQMTHKKSLLYKQITRDNWTRNKIVYKIYICAAQANKNFQHQPDYTVCCSEYQAKLFHMV